MRICILYGIVTRLLYEPSRRVVGNDVRAKRVDSEIPMNPFTAGVYVAMMIAQVSLS